MCKSKFVLKEKAHKLVLCVYKMTNTFPKSEVYGITSQMRRAAVSIPSNILEGKSRDSNKEYLRFLMISRGSYEELKYQLLLSKDLNYISEEKYNDMNKKLEDMGKLLSGLIRSVRNMIDNK